MTQFLHYYVHLPTTLPLTLQFQLYDLEKEVAIEALDILDEACEEDSFLKALVLQQPQLLHLGEKGAALLTRFFSVRRGFTLMSQLGYLDVVLEKWNKVGRVSVLVVGRVLVLVVGGILILVVDGILGATCTYVVWIGSLFCLACNWSKL